MFNNKLFPLVFVAIAFSSPAKAVLLDSDGATADFIASFPEPAVKDLDGGVAQVIAEKTDGGDRKSFMDMDHEKKSRSQSILLDNFTFSQRSRASDSSSFFLLGVGILALAAARRKFAL